MTTPQDIANEPIITLGIANQLIAKELAVKIAAEVGILVEIKIDKKQKISLAAREYLQFEVAALLDALLFLKGPGIAKKYSPNALSEAATAITTDLVNINEKSFNFIYGSLLEFISKHIPDL